MSFNANTIYPAVDINDIAKQCKDAITPSKVYVVSSFMGDIEGVFSIESDADACARRMNALDKDFWIVTAFELQ
jgi:hypothetical protein